MCVKHTKKKLPMGYLLNRWTAYEKVFDITNDHENENKNHNELPTTSLLLEYEEDKK